jgi:hypothetical protein
VKSWERDDVGVSYHCFSSYWQIKQFTNEAEVYLPKVPYYIDLLTAKIGALNNEHFVLQPRYQII